MRRFILLLAAAVFCGDAEAQNWTVIPTGTTQSLNAINSSFSNRYVVGDGGFLAESDNTLLNWTEVDLGLGSDLLALHRPSGGQLWVSGDDGRCRVLYSGAWHDGDIPNVSEDFVVFSRSSGWSFAAGTGGSIYRSTNLGQSWSLQQSGTTNALRDGNGFVSSLAYVVGDNGTILKTTNAGADWVQKPAGTTADLHAYHEVVSGVIAAAGENGTILRSTDGGETWTSIESGTNATLYDMTSSFVSGFQVLAVGEGGAMIRSMDAGLTWCSLDSETDTDLYACEWSSGSTMLVMGVGGYMAITYNGAGGCLDLSTVRDIASSPGLRLMGPWPQPLSGEGRCEFSVGRDQHLRADIVDVAGRRLVTLFDQAARAEERYGVRFDVASLASGTYFVRVTSNEGTVSRRALVVR